MIAQKTVCFHYGACYEVEMLSTLHITDVDCKTGRALHLLTCGFGERNQLSTYPWFQSAFCSFYYTTSQEVCSGCNM